MDFCLNCGKTLIEKPLFTSVYKECGNPNCEKNKTEENGQPNKESSEYTIPVMRHTISSSTFTQPTSSFNFYQSPQSNTLLNHFLAGRLNSKVKLKASDGTISEIVSIMAIRGVNAQLQSLEVTLETNTGIFPGLKITLFGTCPDLFEIV